jgi:hypothetical protein
MIVKFFTRNKALKKFRLIGLKLLCPQLGIHPVIDDLINDQLHIFKLQLVQPVGCIRKSLIRLIKKIVPR